MQVVHMREPDEAEVTEIAEWVHRGFYAAIGELNPNLDTCRPGMRDMYLALARYLLANPPAGFHPLTRSEK